MILDSLWMTFIENIKIRKRSGKWLISINVLAAEVGWLINWDMDREDYLKNGDAAAALTVSLWFRLQIKPNYIINSVNLGLRKSSSFLFVVFTMIVSISDEYHDPDTHFIINMEFYTKGRDINVFTK